MLPRLFTGLAISKLSKIETGLFFNNNKFANPIAMGK